MSGKPDLQSIYENSKLIERYIKIFIVKSIQSNPFDIDWSKITEYNKRSELSIKYMYNEIVSAREHMKCCIKNMNESSIIKIIEDIKNKCSLCNINIYSAPYIWQGYKYCDSCYYKNYNEETEKLWSLVSEYSIKTNKNKCNICYKVASFDNSMITKFNYDHINMFNKTDSVCKLVREGAKIEDIYKEIDKCQLLCVSCHSVVTKVEVMCGFIRIKKQLTKDFNESEDEEKKDKIINE
jgi:esterase/lipase superfamily enzyme